jgi:hypothetical protein
MIAIRDGLQTISLGSSARTLPFGAKLLEMLLPLLSRAAAHWSASGTEQEFGQSVQRVRVQCNICRAGAAAGPGNDDPIAP